MKEKINATLKRLQEKPKLVSASIVSFVFLIFIMLSAQTAGLFLKEILLVAFIVGLALLNTDISKRED
jgi:positive regulator of sigma E activity